jgi:hypothetical protein
VITSSINEQIVVYESAEPWPENKNTGRIDPAVCEGILEQMCLYVKGERGGKRLMVIGKSGIGEDGREKNFMKFR